MVLVPIRRPPTHPGEVLVEEFLKPLGISQVELAETMGITFQRVNAIANERRSVTPDTALRLAKVFGTSPDFWLNLQQARDLYEAMNSEEAKEIQKLKRIAATA
ncbi:MAG: HigA family addiction module antitoxin [Gemmatimonadales bacterium]